MPRLVLIGCAAALLVLALVVFTEDETQPPEVDLIGSDLAVPDAPGASAGLLRGAANPEGVTAAGEETAGEALPTGPFEFFVLSSETEEPLDRVELETDEGDRIGTTGRDGRLRIEDGGASELIVRATRSGYLPYEGYASAGRLLSLTLRPGIPISGTVLVADSDSPAPHARLRVWDVDLGQEIASLSADEEGRFTIPAVRPNRPFRIVTQAEGYVPRVQTENFDAPITDLIVRVGGGGTLVGTVLDDWGAPVVSKMVQLVHPGQARPGSGREPKSAGLLLGLVDARSARTVTDADGQYRFAGIAPQAAVQPVVVMGPRFEARGKPAVFNKPDLTIERDILIPQPAALRIHVVDDAGRYLRNATVKVISALAIWEAGPQDRKPDGSLLLRDLTPGGARVRAAIQGAPAPPIPPDPVNLRPGKEESVYVVFPRGLSLHGVVRDKRGDPIWRARISWITKDEKESARTVTNGAGEYGLTRLKGSAGSLTVRARDVPHTRIGFETASQEGVLPGLKSIDFVLLDGTQVRGRFRGLGEDAALRVVLTPGGPAGAGTLWLDKQGNFSWRGPPAERRGMLVFRTPGYPPLLQDLGHAFKSEEIRDLGDLAFEATNPFLGRVTDQYGNALRGAKVTLAAAWGEGRSQRTDRDGEFQFTRLPERKVPIRLEAQGIPPNRGTLLPTSQQVRQVFRMFPVGYLVLSVLDRRKRPAKGVELTYATEKESKKGTRAKRKTARVNAQGELQLKLAPGTYIMLAATRRQRELAEFQITIEAGQVLEKTVRLESRSAYARRKQKEKQGR